MLKKLILTSSILAMTTSCAFAFSSPYVGAGLGITANTSNNGNFGSYRGVPFSLFGGYGGVIEQNFYLAGEVSGTVGTAEIVRNGRLDTTYGYGVSILPGLMLSDHTLAFTRLGAVWTHFDSASKTVLGGQFGFGMQTSLTQNVDLRGEYDFNAYRQISINGVSTKPRSDVATISLVYNFA